MLTTGRVARRTLSVVALTAAALAGCRPSTTDQPGAGVDASATPTAVPATPASALFDTRAEQTAGRLRASGALAECRTRLLLLQPPVVAAGFATDAARLAFTSGSVKLAPAVAGAAGEAVLHLGDARTTQVLTLDAADALAQASPGLSCEVISKPCSLLLTRVERGTSEVVTNHGVTRVPTWRLFADDLTSPLKVVAVAPSDLGAAADPLPPERSFQDGLLPGDWVTQRSEVSLVVGITSGTCDLDLQAHVWQGPDAVVVGGPSETPNGDCNSRALTTSATVTLTAPLAGRPVVDVATGRILSYPRP